MRSKVRTNGGETTMKKQIALAASLAFVGTAIADSHNEKKGDAIMKKPEIKKPEPKPDAPKPTGMEQPKPPAEVAAMAAMLAGNWKCAGKGMMDPSKPDMTEFKGTFKAALDNSLDKFWVKGEWTGTTTTKIKMKGVMYVTFDPTTKKWHRLMLDNWGMNGSESSAGLPAGAKEGKITWEGESRMGGTMIKGRTTEEVAAKSMKMTAEMNPDGKKWVTGMEMTCTK
jgi:hypothetical protein